MIESAYLLVGVAAFGWTLLTVGAAVSSSADGLVTLGGVVGFVLWGVWTFASFDIVAQSGCSSIRYSEPELAFVGVIMAIPCAWIALTGPVETASDATKTRIDDL
jgi:hypothetical protein